jgi:hypothetical protein
VSRSDGPTTNHNTDRFADDGAEHLTATRTICTRIAVTGWCWRGSGRTWTKHDAGDGRSNVLLFFFHRNLGLRDFFYRLRSWRRFLQRNGVDLRRVVNAARGTRAGRRRDWDLLGGSHEASGLIILHASRQLDTGRLSGA